MKIAKEDFDKLYSDDISKKEYDRIIYLINERFFDIIILLFPKIQEGGDWFDYANCDYEAEDSDGQFDIDKYKSEICIGGCCDFPEPYCCTDEGNGYIPTRWLWTDDNEIKKEFNKEVEKAKQEKLNKKQSDKQKREELKVRKVKFREIIKTKLTKEELKYIDFK